MAYAVNLGLITSKTPYNKGCFNMVGGGGGSKCQALFIKVASSFSSLQDPFKCSIYAKSTRIKMNYICNCAFSEGLGVHINKHYA